MFAPDIDQIFSEIFCVFCSELWSSRFSWLHILFKFAFILCRCGFIFAIWLYFINLRSTEEWLHSLILFYFFYTVWVEALLCFCLFLHCYLFLYFFLFCILIVHNKCFSVDLPVSLKATTAVISARYSFRLSLQHGFWRLSIWLKRQSQNLVFQCLIFVLA